ncbi:phage tail sheath family protein, partial [Streptomyces sp. NPDC012623]
MPSYLSPGVYVEEVQSGSRPIEGVGTSVAAFVGFARRGPFNEPTLIANWGQFVSQFGDFVEGTYLASSVYGFFANGGGTCYVIRIGGGAGAGGTGGSDAEGDTAASGALPVGADTPLGPYLVRTLPGVTGEITVEVAEPEAEDPPQDVFTLRVSRDGTVVETYPSVSTKRSKDNVVAQVKAQSQLIEVQEPGGGGAPPPPPPPPPTHRPPPPAPPPPPQPPPPPAPPGYPTWSTTGP